MTIKIDAKTKKEAQKMAAEMGLSLSNVVRGYMKYFVKTKRVELDLSEEPSEYLIEALKEAEKDKREGRVSPGFKSAKEAIKWLHEDHDL